jgi:hypothetical protein
MPKFAMAKETRRPCCPILQAQYGGDLHVDFYYDSSLWHTAPPEGGVAMVEGTPEQFYKHGQDLLGINNARQGT